jgi:hypothetical protein
VAAPPGSWRVYDSAAPDPGYFEFDWITARYPDLYDAFARSTAVLVRKCCGLGGRRALLEHGRILAGDEFLQVIDRLRPALYVQCPALFRGEVSLVDRQRG